MTLDRWTVFWEPRRFKGIRDDPFPPSLPSRVSVEGRVSRGSEERIQIYSRPAETEMPEISRNWRFSSPVDSESDTRGRDPPLPPPLPRPHLAAPL